MCIWAATAGDIGLSPWADLEVPACRAEELVEPFYNSICIHVSNTAVGWTPRIISPGEVGVL